MAEYKYAMENFDKEKMARACARNIGISTKVSTELARALRGKKLELAIKYLQDVLEQKRAVPYRRYGAEMAHQKGAGIATGGFPKKASEEFLKLLLAAKKNAASQEIEGELFIKAISARKGPARHHFGRMPGRQMKNTHLEVVLAARAKKAVKKTEKKEETKK